MSKLGDVLGGGQGLKHYAGQTLTISAFDVEEDADGQESVAIVGTNGDGASVRIRTTSGKGAQMATIRYVPTSPGQDPPERKVPDELEPRATERGVEWSDEDGAKHVVPWSAILEFID